MEHNFLEPTLEKQLKGHRNSITAVFFNPNEQQIASSSLDNTVLLWNIRGCNIRSYRFEGHSEAVTDVTFSPSGKHMASASRDKTVRIWVPTITGSTGMFKAHSQTVRSVQFSPDGSKILTASDDKIVKLWSSDKFKFIASFVGHTNWVRCARLSCDGSVIASCSDDKTTRLWNPESGENVHTYKDQKGHGVHVAWHPTGCYIAIGTSQGNVRLYDIRTHTLVQFYSIHSDAITQLAFHPSGSYIMTASKDGKMKILDLLEGHPIFTLNAHNGAVNAVNFSPTGDSFVSAGDDKLVFLWKTNFTELSKEGKENVSQNETSAPRSASQSSRTGSTARGRKQGSRLWYLCYHSTKFPVTTFSRLDDTLSADDNIRLPSANEEPNANSTLNEENIQTPCDINISCANIQQAASINPIEMNRSQASSSKHSETRNKCETDASSQSCHSQPRNSQRDSGTKPGCSSCSVGHISHIPRTPPNPVSCTIPSILNKSVGIDYDNQDLFGMVKLKDNDVCYTSGTIEWVGRKRSFPINSGFKVLNGSHRLNEPLYKRIRTVDKNVTYGVDDAEGNKGCDCAEVLPMVNAIVDHLNALHEAVDLVDLRLNTVEGLVGRGDK